MTTTFETLILGHMRFGEIYTTQSLTEQIFHCMKSDQIYNSNVEDVGKEMQKLYMKGIVTKERQETGKGYSICLWRLRK